MTVQGRVEFVPEHERDESGQAGVAHLVQVMFLARERLRPEFTMISKIEVGIIQHDYLGIR